MSTQLHVVDMSPAIYAGSYNKHSFIPLDVVPTPDGYRERIIPTGGTSMLFNILAQYMSRGDFAFVADRRPTIKQEMFPGYKGSREHRHEIAINKDVAEFILQDCGFRIFYADGYEADDVVANIVRQYHDKYDDIFVHTADSDLYILVDDTVSILPTSTQAKKVTLDNYEDVVKKGYTTPYNTVVWNKFLHGDPGKDIPPLPAPTAEFLRKRFCYNAECCKNLGNWMWLRAVFEKYFPQYYDRLQLFFPLPIEEKFDLVQEPDKVRVQEWAFEIRNKKVPGRHGDLKAKIKEMEEAALYLDN